MKLLLLFFVLASSTAFAQQSPKPAIPKKLPQKKAAAPNPSTASETKPESKKRVQLDSSNSMRINYGYPASNKDKSQIDSGSLIMREGNSGRLVQIHLVETEPD